MAELLVIISRLVAKLYFLYLILVHLRHLVVHLLDAPHYLVCMMILSLARSAMFAVFIVFVLSLLDLKFHSMVLPFLLWPA